MEQKKFKKILIIFSDFYPEVSKNLIDGAENYLNQNNFSFEKKKVDGSLEIPFLLHKFKNEFDGFIVLGCVIKGETDHFHYVCNAVSIGLKDLNLNIDIPIIFGVLTDNTEEQAINRSGGKFGNKGVEAAISAIKMAHLNN